MGFKQRKFIKEVLTAKVSVRRNTKQLMKKVKIRKLSKNILLGIKSFREGEKMCYFVGNSVTYKS